MGSITVAKMDLDVRMPQGEDHIGLSAEDGDTAVLRAAQAVAAAQRRCMAVYVEDGGRDPAWEEAAAGRLAALQALIATPAESAVGLEAKRDTLADLEIWIGSEDPYCGLLKQVMNEAINLLRLQETRVDEESERAKSMAWASPGRWLMGAAASVPAFIVDRFGLG